MGNKELTAVDWLLSQVNGYSHCIGLPHPINVRIDIPKEIIEQTFKMQKHQMVGLLDWMNKIASEEPMRLETDHDDIVEQYYSETFKTE
jgi:hypothetical protein